MEGDVLLIEDSHKVIAQNIIKCILSDIFFSRSPLTDQMYLEAVDKIKQKQDPTVVITIAGGSGAGKSETAHELAAVFRTLGVVSKCVSADNFYKIAPKSRTSWRKEHTDLIGASEYDWELINRVVSDFRARKINSSFPTVDLNTQEIDTLITDFSKVSILIIDGLFSISTRLKDCDYRVFITASAEKMKLAQIKRGKENAEDPFRGIVRAKEAEDIIKVLKEVDEVIYIDGNNFSVEWRNGVEAVQS